MLVGSMIASLAIGSLAFAVGASGHDRQGGRGGAIFRVMLTPSLHTDPAIHGVAPGGRDWALAQGRARLEGERADRRHDSSRSTRARLSALELRVQVEGLVLRGTRNPGLVTSIKASIFCGSDTAPAFLSRSASLSARGDAELDARVSLRKCLAPVVLVHPNGDETHYIAVSGFGN